MASTNTSSRHTIREYMVDITPKNQAESFLIEMVMDKKTYFKWG